MTLEHREQGETRAQILQLLRRQGQMTAAELSDALGIGAVGVRQHLALLDRDDLVRANGVRRGVGRPSHLYMLHRASRSTLPQALRPAGARRDCVCRGAGRRSGGRSTVHGTAFAAWHATGRAFGRQEPRGPGGRAGSSADRAGLYVRTWQLPDRQLRAESNTTARSIASHATTRRPASTS